jgi:ribose-phosphate pyrophosphokinase
MIKIRYPDGTLEQPEFITFSGGEEHVRIGGCVYGGTALIIAKIDSSIELVRLLLVTNALKGGTSRYTINLQIPYIPYARQDRVCSPGDPFSLKVFADLINAQGYSRVYCSDPHSIVTQALINNLVVTPQSFYANDLYQSVFREYDYIISPDAGAASKSYDFAKEWRGDSQLVQCLKKRDPKTGDILSTYVPHEVKGNCLIIDDICDGGRTFIELARVLRNKKADKVDLFVTHGIFSQGLGPILQWVNNIYTTDSFYSECNVSEDERKRVKIIHRHY